MQGRLVASPGTNLEVWSKPLSGTNTRAVALFNRGAATRIDHRAVERARDSRGRRDGSRSLEPHRSGNVQRLLHRLLGAEPRRRRCSR